MEALFALQQPNLETYNELVKEKGNTGDIGSKEMNFTCSLVLLPKWGGRERGKYGPETEGLSQCGQCQPDFTVDVPQSGEWCAVPAC